MMLTKAYAAKNEKDPLGPFNIERRKVSAHDVQIKILYCGICHTDVHIVKNEWKNTIYPCVPGHEIVGEVVSVGNEVKSFKPGEIVAVGCLVNSCQTCPNCKNHNEQFCPNFTLTYNSPEDGKATYGGYSTHMVVDEKFVLHVPKSFKESDYAKIAPLLCAGITTYSPLRHWKVGKDSKVGVVGLGGLGHIALKIAHALGAYVVLFTTSKGKIEDAKKMGADEVVISKDEEAMKKHLNSFDFILNTVSAEQNLDAYTSLLKVDGTLCLVGLPEHPHPSPSVANLIFGRRSIAGSIIGGLKETQEMLDFCAKNNITADIELIPINKVNEAYERMLKSDVKYRFVIDLATLG